MTDDLISAWKIKTLELRSAIIHSRRHELDSSVVVTQHSQSKDWLGGQKVVVRFPVRTAIFFFFWRLR
jgi:hypothetical protein